MLNGFYLFRDRRFTDDARAIGRVDLSKSAFQERRLESFERHRRRRWLVRGVDVARTKEIGFFARGHGGDRCLELGGGELAIHLRIVAARPSVRGEGASERNECLRHDYSGGGNERDGLIKRWWK